MQGNTHRIGGMLCALAGYTILESKGMLIRDVSPLLQLAVIYPFSIYGSVFPDLDHHEDSIPSHDIVSVGINKVLHATTAMRKANGGKLSPILSVFDAKHRSWQTHSDMFLIICILMSMSFINSSVMSPNDIILKLVFTGFILGVVSHMILDLLTPEGIWCIGLGLIGKISGSKSLPRKIHFVPKSRFFATGGVWEKLVRYVMWVICSALFIRIVYHMLPYRFI